MKVRKVNSLEGLKFALSMAAVLTVSANANAVVTATWTEGKVQLNWTDTAKVNCSTNPSPYRVRLFKNGQLSYPQAPRYASVKTVTYDIPTVFEKNTTYQYVVDYFICSGSGGSFYTAGSVSKTFQAAPILERRVIFIHSDVQGSPAAESDERGNRTNG